MASEQTEITFKDLLILLMKFGKILRRRWYVVALSCAIFGGYLVWKAFQSPPKYQANLTFMLNDNSGGGLNQVGALLGQFGLGGGGKGDNNLDKITELARSHRILHATLFDSATIDGKADLFANHFIYQLGLQDKWKNDTTGLKNFIFKRSNFEQFNRVENNALQDIYGALNNKTDALFSCSYSKESTILTMSVASPNEDLSIYFTRRAFENLSEFYVLKTTERERSTYDVLRGQKDSIYAVMRGKERSAAAMQDRNRGLILESDRLKPVQLQKDAQISTLAYGEMLKQFSLADFALKNNTPFIQPIDMPNGPIEPTRKSKKLALILGVGLGFLIGGGGVVLYEVIKNALSEIKNTEGSN